MKVFVAGATGVVGKRAVARLVEAGHEVTAVARSAEKAELVRSLGATPVQVSLFDRDGLTAMAGHDAVVTLATKIPSISRALAPGAWDENNRIRTEGSATLVDAAIAAGVSRYVQESITFTYPDGGDAWIDAASTEIDPPKIGASAADAETSAARFTEAGGSGIVLRFGMFYAPDAVHTQEMTSRARRGISLVAGRPDAYQSMIHADDAASAVVAALDAPAGTYDIVDDDPLTRRDVAKVLGGALRLPGSLARLGGSYTEIMARSQRVSNRRFKELTSWAPRYPSLRQGLPAVVDAMSEEPDRSLAERLVRPVLFVLAAAALQLGLWITISPRSFYDDFPGLGRQWVSVDGPYNEHLLRDFGQSQLALAVVLLAAFVRPERFLVRVAALASLVFAVPHLVYHATHLDVYDTGDQVANVVLLVAAVMLPAVLVLGTARSTPAVKAADTARGSWAPSASSSPPSSAASPV
jgi:nucleoside-diphosphate-sugar epimerase